MTTALTLAAALLASIIGANVATSELGLVPVAPGLDATAGTYLAGLVFVLRDHLQDRAGKLAVVLIIAAGAGLSYALADPRIALASAAAFGISELVDFAIYTPLRSRGYVPAAVASNVAGAVVDSLLFLTIAGFPVAAMPGQVVGKLWVTVLAVGLVVAIGRRRALLR